MNAIQTWIQRIPDGDADEAFSAIETITTYGKSRADILCHLAHEFRLTATTNRDGTLTLFAEGRRATICTERDFLPTLRRTLYEIDEDIAEGRYQQTPLKARWVFIDTPPADMDIPVWDEKTKTWYDAEY